MHVARDEAQAATILATIVAALGAALLGRFREPSDRDVRAHVAHGLREDQQAEKLGYAPRAAVIHRDHMVHA